MRPMQRLPWGFVLLGLVLGPVVLAGAQQASARFGQEIAEDGSQEVWGLTTVGQTFTIPFDGLYRVDLFLGTGGRVNTEALILRLRAAPHAKTDLRSDTLSASSVASDRWVTFEFPPISDSGGQSYYLSLDSQLSKPGDCLSVFRSRQDRYRDGTYYLDGAPADGDLAFLFYCRPGLAGWWQGLLRLLARDKPSVWGQPGCYGGLAVLHLVLLVLLMRRLHPLESEAEVPPTPGDLEIEP